MIPPPPPALTAEQRHVLQRIKTIGAQEHATPIEVKSAVETGVVESGLRNLKGGDADSAGWRQERASLYKDPTNLDASIRRYFGETRAVRGKYTSAGDLAAAVQRPAAQYRGRYQQASGRADSLLKSIFGTLATASPTTDAASPGPTVDQAGFDQARRRAVLGTYLAKHDPSSLLLKTGVVSTKAPALADFTKPADAPADPAPTASAAAAPRAGRVIVAPGAERAGIGLQKPIVGFLGAVSAASRRPITVTTGTNHDRLTVNGNVSDHWGGNGADIGLGGDARSDRAVAAKGDLIAAHAIQVASGKGFRESLAIARQGGIHNYQTPRGRVQIIWRADGHYDHVHAGVNPSR